MPDLLRVSTSDNKYTVIQEEQGGMRFLRHGEDWPAANVHFAHVGLILTLAQDLEGLQKFRDFLFALCPTYGTDVDGIIAELKKILLEG